MSAYTKSKTRFNEVVSKIFGGFSEAFSAFGSFINSVDDIDEVSFDEIKEKGKGNSVDSKIIEALELEEKARGELENKFFGIKEKDEDGYNKLEDKLEDIKTSVPGKVVENAENKQRQNGGRQKTRVDED